MDDVEDRGKKMGKALALGFAAAGAAAAGALVVGLKKSVDAAKDAEASMAKVKTIVDNAGISFSAHAKEIDKVIQAHSRLTGFDDEELSESFANMVRTTGNLNEAFKLNGLAADIARSKGMELSGAQSLLARVYNGSYTGVKRLGIAIEPVTKAQDKLKEGTTKATDAQIKAAKAADKAATSQAAIAKLQKAFGGQAEAYGKTAAGAQERFGVALENVQEKLGAKLLPIFATVANAAAKFLDQIDRGTGAGGRFADIVSGAFDRVKGVIGGAVITVKGIVSAFKDGNTWALALAGGLAGLAVGVAIIKTISAVTKAWAAAQVLLNVAMTANPIGLVVVGLVALGAGLVVAYKKSETFRNIVNGAFNAIRDNVGPAFEVVKTVVGHVVDVVKGYLNGMATVVRGVVKVVKGVLTGDFAQAWDGVKTIVRGALQSLTAVIRGLWEPLGKAMLALAKALVRALGEGLKALPGAVADVSISVGKAIGKGILSGLDGLGHMLLGKAKAALSFTAAGLPGPAGALGAVIKAATGDGIGNTLGTPAFGGGLMGARPSLGPFAGAAARFGLRVSSGKRAGAITSSGNVSYHSSGEAIDVAGSPAGMAGFFRQMKATAGGRLAELIYTGPGGGAGIKDGRSYTYGGKVAADHHDHVHVALDTGVPGVGDGPGKIFSWAKGHSFSDEQAAGWVGNVAQESGFSSSVVQPGGEGHGLMQWGGSRFAALQAFASGRKKPWTDFETQLDFAWKELQGPERGAYSAIKGSKSLSAAVSAIASRYERAGVIGNRMDPARAALARFGKSSSSKSKPKTASGGGVGEYNPEAVYNVEGGLASPVLGGQADVWDYNARAQAKMEGRSLTPAPSKGYAGSGPRKGITQAEGEGYAAAAQAKADAAAAAPTREDYIRENIANASLTAGTEDDLLYANELLGLKGDELNAARATGDPRLVTTAIDAYKSAGDAVKALTEAVEGNTAALEEQRKSFEALIAADYRNQFNVSQSQYGILAQALTDVVSGRLGGTLGLGLSGLRAPAGSVARA